jgi:hypothetical protein
VLVSGVGFASVASDQGHGANRAACAVDDLQRRSDKHGTLGRQLAQVGERGETVLVGGVQQIVRRVGRFHAAGLTGVGANALGAPADGALGENVLDAVDSRSGRVRAGFIGVEIGVLISHAGIPVRAHQHPLARLDFAVLGLPRLHAGGIEEEVRVLCHFSGAIDHVDRGDEILRRDRVGVPVGKILAGDPVMRRIEMGAGMFAELEPVPGEERAVAVIFGDLVDLDLGRVLGEILRQLEQRRVGAKPAGKIDDLDLALEQHCGEIT